MATPQQPEAQQHHQQERRLPAKTPRTSAIVIGAGQGVGRATALALAADGVRVAAVGRDRAKLEEVRAAAGAVGAAGAVSTHAFDATDANAADRLIAETDPDLVVVSAGARTPLALLGDPAWTWEAFSAPWNTDVRISLQVGRTAIARPLRPGSLVVLVSSGAGLFGSPLSGGYAGAKRMLWLMSNYAHGVAAELGLGISFQALVPQQIVGATDLGRAAAEAYARRKGVTTEAFLAGFGAPLTPALYGSQVATILTDPQYQTAAALGLKGDGIRKLEERPA